MQMNNNLQNIFREILTKHFATYNYKTQMRYLWSKHTYEYQILDNVSVYFGKKKIWWISIETVAEKIFQK